MFTELDRILYPDRCEVIQISPQRFLYPIFKNGSSSLRSEAERSGWRTLLNSQISQCQHIEVFLRHPESRFVSGFNTYVENLILEEPYLDTSTVVWFGMHHLFMNRHYLPQFLWLTNLARYANDDCILHLRNVSDLKELTDIRKNESESRYEFAMQILSAPNMNAYIRLDSYLYSRVGDSMTHRDLLRGFESEEPQLYKQIFLRDRSIANALP